MAKAMHDLQANGKPVTLNSVHAALGFRGSMTTVNKLFKEIKASAKTTPEPDQEALKTFGEVWTRAMDAGRKQNAMIIEQQEADLQALGQENERLDGLVVAAQAQTETLQKEKSDLESQLTRATAGLGSQLNQAQAALVEAHGRAAQAFQQLSEAQRAHVEEIAFLQAELNKAVQKSHTAEMELVACKAKLEAK